MTKKQIALLEKLIAAERYYWQQTIEKGFASVELRKVECGKFNEIDPRTVQSLVDAGLCDSHASETGNTCYVWLK